MPLSKDAHGGGTEADGRKSTEYCSHCYAAGQFTDPAITLDQMVAKVQGKLKEMGFPGFLTRMLTKNIPTLRRWQASARAVV